MLLPMRGLMLCGTVLLHHQHRGCRHVRKPLPVHRGEHPDPFPQSLVAIQWACRSPAWKPKYSLRSTTPTYPELTSTKQVFLASTNSKAATVAMSTVPLVLSVCTSLNALAAGSRQIWSLARDQALPFSSWFRKVSLIGSDQCFLANANS
jgi:hypothetical protein